MNRQDFYLNLALELNNLKVPPELINTHIDQFKQYLQTLSEEDAEKQIASFGDVKSLAANIYRLLCGGDDAPEPVNKAPVKPAGESVYDAFRVEEEEGSEDIVDLLGDTSIATAETVNIESIDDTPIDTPNDMPAPIHKRAIKEFVPKTDAMQETQPESLDTYNEDNTDGEQMAMDFGSMIDESYIAPDPSAFTDKPSDGDTLVIDSPILPPEGRAYYTPEDDEDAEDEPFTEFTFDDLPKRKERSTGGLILFYALFILTLPITLTLFAASMTLFGVAYVVLGALTGLCFALIFIGSVLGATMALSGGVYSVLQFNSGATAVGLFELGLSLVIVGITIFVTFLFSMLSLKWLPALIKYLTVFMRFYLNKLIYLFKNLKGRCEQL